MEELKKFIQEEIQRFHKITLLEGAKKQIQKELNLLKENEEVEDMVIPDYENDCFIEDKPRGGYDVSCSGKFLGNFEDMDLSLQAVERWMQEHKFYPTIWFFSDHGNYWPIDSQGNELKETKDVKAMYRNAGMEPPHPGKGIHTKKFHKCVTSVGEKGGKNPYAICMSSMGKDKAVKASHRTDENTITQIDQKENLEYFLSFNNETVYWKWINGEIDDNGAITIMRDIEGMEYDPSINYKEKYSGDTIS